MTPERIKELRAIAEYSTDNFSLSSSLHKTLDEIEHLQIDNEDRKRREETIAGGYSMAMQEVDRLRKVLEKVACYGDALLPGTSLYDVAKVAREALK